MSVHSLTRNLDRDAVKEAKLVASTNLRAKADAIAQSGKAGFHKAAQNYRGPNDEPVSTLHWLSAQAEAEGLAPSDRELAEAESYWLKRLNVRPWEVQREEKVKAYARHRWAMEKLFEDCGAPLRGPSTATVGKAFTTSTTQVIFPFAYESFIVAGILASPLVDRLAFADIPVNSHSVDHAEFNDNAGDGNFTEGGEGTRAKEVIITATNRPITLRKFLAKAKISYEAARLQRIPVFERGLMRVGQRFMIQITDCGMNTLVAGDGAGGGAATTVAATTTGSPVYADVISIYTKYSQGYEAEMGLWVAPNESIQDLLKMPEFKDPLAGRPFANQGMMPTPAGEEILRWDSTGNVSGWLTTSILNFKPDIAMVKYTEGGLMTETDRIIDGQWEDTVISQWTNFGIFDRNACIVGTNW